MSEEIDAYRSTLRRIICMTDSEMLDGDGARTAASRVLIQFAPRYVVKEHLDPETGTHYTVMDNLMGLAVGYETLLKEQAEGWAERYNNGELGNPNDLVFLGTSWRDLKAALSPSSDDKMRRLRNALAGLVGSNNREELKQMHADILGLPIPLAGDRAVILEAIVALLDTL